LVGGHIQQLDRASPILCTPLATGPYLKPITFRFSMIQRCGLLSRAFEIKFVFCLLHLQVSKKQNR